MRRFLTLVCLLCLAVPAGISISGCSRNPNASYCNGLGYGLKTSAVSSITLSPATTGVSLAFGQTSQLSTPKAYTCKSALVSVSSYTYGTTNSKLADISPAGNICAGTWNRNTGGGISDYTVCTAPSSLPSTNGLPYSTAYVTASTDSVTSNPVEVFVHAPVTAVGLVTNSSSGTSSQCYSQNTQATLDAEACYGSAQYELCAPSTLSSSDYTCKGGLASGVSSVPTCTAAVGTLTYTVGTSSIATITTDTTTNVVTITAEQPGTTAITASVAGSGSSAGYFSTCPPASITLRLANGSTSGSISQGVTQNLQTTITDTKGTTITGLSLDYQSTNPVDISVASTGAVTASYPGVASVYAICQPTSCNPAPSTKIGMYGTGLPISSNPVTITTPGTSSNYVWFSAPGKSRYVVPVDLLSESVGSTVKLPYVPNSMVMDKLGTDIYFGSSTELMIYNTTSGTVTTENTSVPGVVLAVAPDNSTVLINDQTRKIFYLYTVSTGAYTTEGGVGSTAAWTPDAKTLYIAGTNASTSKPTLFVYNANTGWTTSDLTSTTGGSQSLAITIPSVGAYLNGSSGYSTVAHTWCPTGTAGDYSSMVFYPASDDVFSVQTDQLTATTDGEHVLGAAVTSSGTTLNDIGLLISPAECSLTSALSTNGALLTPSGLSVDANATAINQVVASPVSNLAFITYTAEDTNTDAKLPYYVPNTYTSGSAYTPNSVEYITLTGASSISAPVAGAFTPDDKYFFVSTAGDNKIHYIKVSTLTDTEQISPNLPACSTSDNGCTYTGSGTVVPATAIAVKPRTAS
jgi:trimeric autotransporter adhesin